MSLAKTIMVVLVAVAALTAFGVLLGGDMVWNVTAMNIVLSMLNGFILGWHMALVRRIRRQLHETPSDVSFEGAFQCVTGMRDDGMVVIAFRDGEKVLQLTMTRESAKRFSVQVGSAADTAEWDSLFKPPHPDDMQ